MELDFAETETGRVLVITSETVKRVLDLLAPIRAEGRRSSDVLREAPVRIYSRTANTAKAPDPALLKRLERLGDALLTPGGGEPAPASMTRTPAAYTYFGQFLAHELTLWKEIEHAGSSSTAYIMDSAIDLKTIFLREPGFPTKLPPHVGESEGLALGQTFPNSGAKMFGCGFVDLPREPGGKALLLEKRNDQNLAISQTHVAITRFAQAALRILTEDQTDGGESRRSVIRHFQSVVLHDYLARIVDPATWADVMMHGRVVVKSSGAARTDAPFFVPHEFSGAIFKFGHAMRRASYVPWNTVNPLNTVPSALQSDLLDLSYAGGALNGFDHRVPQNWVTDWRHLLGVDAFDPIKARAIGTTLGKDLFCLPARLFQARADDRGCPDTDPEVLEINLARRTLLAGAEMQLPTGQDYARTVEQKLIAAGSPCRIRVLKKTELKIPGNPVATGIMREGKVGERFVDQTPLWVYILREAAVLGHGNHLGPLGSRIVAETMSAAVETSGTGMIVNGILQPFEADPRFGGKHTDKFDLADLVRLAFDDEF